MQKLVHRAFFKASEIFRCPDHIWQFNNYHGRCSSLWILGCCKVMSGLSIFIFMAILRMVLVINYPQVIWTYLCWMTTLRSKTNERQYATITWQTMKKGLQICPSEFVCVSEYTFFIAYTLLCMALKTIIIPVWMQISGLLWWYIFYKNMLDDADRQSLLEIFSNPNTGHPHEFILPQDRKLNPHLLHP